MGGGHQQIGDEIVLNGLHALDSLTASVLGLEIVHGHPFDISEVCHGDDGVLPGNHVLHADIHFVIADLASSVVAVFDGDDGDLLPDHAEQQLFIREDRL